MKSTGVSHRFNSRRSLSWTCCGLHSSSRRAHQEAPEPQQGPTSFGSLHVVDTQQCQAATVAVTAFLFPMRGSAAGFL